MDTEISEDLARFLEGVALRAGEHILRLRDEGIDIERKDDGSPVTRADRQAEALIIEALGEVAADIPIVSEENTASHRQPPVRQFFLVDALDGTKEFVRPNGKNFTVNIALVEESVPTLGVLYAPVSGRLFSGISGIGAWEISGKERREILAQGCGEDALVAVASRSHPDGKTARWLDSHNVGREFSLGSSLKFCLLASGEADVYPRFAPTMEWDTAAGDAILRAAGGAVLDLDDKDLRYGKDGYRNGGFVAWAKR